MRSQGEMPSPWDLPVLRHLARAVAVTAALLLAAPKAADRGQLTGGDAIRCDTIGSASVWWSLKRAA